MTRILLSSLLSFTAIRTKSAENDTGADSFRVATFNIRLPADKSPNSWKERAPKCRVLIQKHGFDLLGVQEATWPQVQDLLEMEGWGFVGAGRDDGKQKGESCGIFYRKDRFELLKSDSFWLSETPEQPGSMSWNTACTRVCTWAELRDRKTDKIFLHFNSHLDHISKEARMNGMKLILDRMQEIANGRPVLLTGDFNTHPSSDPSTPYGLAATRLRDSLDISKAPHAGPTRTFTAFRFSENPKGSPIDFIFVSDEVQVLTHTTHNDSENQLYPSDHFPVSADVLLE